MKFFQLIPAETHIDFIGKFRIFLTISVLVCAAIIVGIFTKGFHFGVDFTGGTVLQIKLAKPTPIDSLRKTITDLGDADASVVSVGTGDTEYMITSRTAGDVKDTSPLSKRLVDKLGANEVQIVQADIVGPKVGAELKMSAIQSLFYSVLLIMVYIWFRFDFRFAPGATVAMIHDLIIAAGYFLVSGTEFTITSIAALLTIAGYSVNDTIVIYDRVREINKGGGNLPIGSAINKALNLTLSRTLLTGGITFLSVVPIAVFCKGDIQSFAIAILVGIFVGIYSTIYIAAPLTIYVEKYMSSRGNKPATRRPTPARA